ncbi:hypothetical protein [Riemerella anatipestifer]|uniref:hypothetical protein n=1 Tax=Riemerella anatipestifer TaxID=34085 RepID=UPI00069986E6|nr:hypothetical protein [Riemerella anatipestifer]
MKKIFFLFLLLILVVSCKKNRNIEESLKKESLIFLKKNQIDTIGYKKEYYLKEDKIVGYRHYILKYYKITNQDSIIIWFTRDDEAKYFIQANHNFYKYNKNLEY